MIFLTTLESCIFYAKNPYMNTRAYSLLLPFTVPKLQQHQIYKLFYRHKKGVEFDFVADSMYWGSRIAYRQKNQQRETHANIRNAYFVISYAPSIYPFGYTPYTHRVRQNEQNTYTPRASIVAAFCWRLETCEISIHQNTAPKNAK